MEDSTRTTIIVFTGIALSVVTNLVSGFIAPSAQKHKRWIWSVFAGLVGVTVVVSCVPSSRPIETNKTTIQESNQVSIEGAASGNTVIQSGGGDVTISSNITNAVSTTAATIEPSLQTPVRLKLSAPNSANLPDCADVLIPDEMSPVNGFEPVIEALTEGEVFGQWDIPNLTYIDLNITSLASREWIKVTNKVYARITKYEPLDEGHILHPGCGAGGKAKTASKLILTNSTDQEFSADVPSYDYFTLEPGELEVFRVRLSALHPGLYTVSLGIEYDFLGETHREWSTEVIQIKAPTALTGWAVDFSAPSKLINISEWVLENGEYHDRNNRALVDTDDQAFLAPTSVPKLSPTILNEKHSIPKGVTSFYRAQERSFVADTSRSDIQQSAEEIRKIEGLLPYSGSGFEIRGMGEGSSYFLQISFPEVTFDASPLDVTCMSPERLSFVNQVHDAISWLRVHDIATSSVYILFGSDYEQALVAEKWLGILDFHEMDRCEEPSVFEESTLYEISHYLDIFLTNNVGLVFADFSIDQSDFDGKLGRFTTKVSLSSEDPERAKLGFFAWLISLGVTEQQLVDLPVIFVVK